MTTISITFMRYYCAVIDQGGISRAAANLNVAASAISSAIDLIEDQLNLTLLNRFRSRGVLPTKSGKAIYQQFKNLIEEFDHVMNHGSNLREALTGEISIGYYAPVAPAFLPRIIKDLTAMHSVSVELIECDNDVVQKRYLAGDFDVIFYVSNNSFLNISSEVLIEAPAYCLMPKNHQLAQKKSIQLEDLKHEALIVLNRPTAAEYYQELFKNAGRNNENMIYANSTEMVRSLVGSGLGCAILNMKPVTDISYAGDKVITKAITGCDERLSLSIGYDNKRPRRIVEAFVKLCRVHISEEAFTVTLSE